MTRRNESPFLIFGHRGAPRLARENSREAVQAALDAGADGVEVDARCLADGAKVLFHDASIGERAIENCSLDHVRSLEGTLTLLHEVLTICAQLQRTIIIEVKEAGWEDELAKMLEPAGDVVVSSFRPAVLIRMRELRPGLQLGIITDRTPRQSLALAASLKLAYVFPSLTVVSASLVREAAALSAKVIPWTAYDRERWEQLRELGCDGVITDVPDLAMKWRGSIGNGERNEE